MLYHSILVAEDQPDHQSWTGAGPVPRCIERVDGNGPFDPLGVKACARFLLLMSSWALNHGSQIWPGMMLALASRTDCHETAQITVDLVHATWQGFFVIISRVVACRFTLTVVCVHDCLHVCYQSKLVNLQLQER